MTPEEWPIAAYFAERNTPARSAGRDRLSTVRADFFLPPEERLTEQERALMTAMLHCLVADLATDIRAALPPGRIAANEGGPELIETLTRAGLLDSPELISLLLRRTDEERIALAARSRAGRRDARVLQGLVSHQDAAVSAAAMGLILARGRRRDRFDQCLVNFDDLSAHAAEELLNAVAAALRASAGSSRSDELDGELSRAIAQLIDRHDSSRSIEALTRILVDLLAQSAGLNDDLLLSFAHEGEVSILAEALALRGGITGAVSAGELLSGDPHSFVRLLHVAGTSRELAAGILASIGDLLGIPDAGAAISRFDSFGPEESAGAKAWLQASPSYRTALAALGVSRG